MSEISSIVAALVAKPGDTVLIGINDYVSDEMRYVVDDHLAECCPGVRFVIIENATAFAAVRPE